MNLRETALAPFAWRNILLKNSSVVTSVCMAVLIAASTTVGQPPASVARPSADRAIDARPPDASREVRKVAMQDDTPSLSPGEDLAAGQGRAAPDDRIVQVRRPMGEAASALEAADVSGRASAAQTEALSELDALLAALQSECAKNGGQCAKPPQPAQRPSPAPGKSSTSGSGASAAVAATPAMTAASRASISNLVKDVWGRLPDRQRQQVLQPLSEPFLPKYAADVEEYFRVLAEEADAGPPAAVTGEESK